MAAGSEGTPLGRLWVVATPIGNLDDITLRAIETLKRVSGILAEDTRRTRSLLDRLGIQKPMRSLHAHTSEERINQYLDELVAGSELAIVTDAGTPVVSDPGGELVQKAWGAGITVTPIPGPSAVTAAISAVPIPCHSFRFVGFLPRKGARLRSALDRLVEAEEATVFFEAPNRITETLRTLAPRLGDRTVAVCRELTKLHEEIVHGTAENLATSLHDRVRGEVTVVVAGNTLGRSTRWDDDRVLARIAELRGDSMAPTAIAKQVASEAGWPRGEVFDLLVATKDHQDDPEGAAG